MENILINYETGEIFKLYKKNENGHYWHVSNYGNILRDG